MKSRRFITPVLMLLLLILLSLILYLNFAHGYLTAKIDTVNRETEFFKTKRLEVEMALQNEQELRKELADIQERLQELNEFYLLDSTMVSDDIFSRLKEQNIKADYLEVYPPDFAGERAQGGTTLLYSPVHLSFTGSYNQAVMLIQGMETSKSGAYKVIGIGIEQSREQKGLYNFEILLQLYYFDNPTLVPVIEEKEKDEEDLLWLYQ